MNLNLDSEGYPTDEFLERIGKLEVIPDIWQFIEEIRDAWWCNDWGFKLTKPYRIKGIYDRKYRTLELHTGGWSGNESIIYALKSSMLWIMYWQKTYRGGHYYFRIPVGDLTNIKDK